MQKVRSRYLNAVIMLLGGMIVALGVVSCKPEELQPIEKYGVPDVTPKYGVEVVSSMPDSPTE